MKDNRSLQVEDQASTPLQCTATFRHRILVVDDEPMIRQLCAELLKEPGYKVDTAENGAAAWDALQQNKYDLLITDHDMPQLSGIELLKKIHSARMVLPVIMMSGTMPTADLARHPELRLAAVLPKPFNIIEYVDAVKKALHPADIAADRSQLFNLKPGLAARPSSASSPQRILVVDDDKDTRQLSLDVLGGSGYEVEGVTDGAAAWEALQTFDYDLIVTDNKMPRMTGVEMLEKLRAARMTLPVIMATTFPPTNDFARKPWLKPDAILERPFSNDDLLETVKKILGTDGGSAGSGGTLLTKYL